MATNAQVPNRGRNAPVLSDGARRRAKHGHVPAATPAEPNVPVPGKSAIAPTRGARAGMRNAVESLLPLLPC